MYGRAGETMTITIPDDVLFAARMTEQEMAVEVAVILYHRGGMALESAAEVAGMGRRQFAHLLASRDIEVDPEHFRTLATATAS
jgi:predicted HTH domain antitoxin